MEGSGGEWRFCAVHSLYLLPAAHWRQAPQLVPSSVVNLRLATCASKTASFAEFEHLQAKAITGNNFLIVAVQPMH